MLNLLVFMCFSLLSFLEFSVPSLCLNNVWLSQQCFIFRLVHFFSLDAMIRSILVINPNSSSSITECIARSAKSPSTSKEFSISFFQGPATAPTSIDNFTDSVLSAAACWSSLQGWIEKADGFVVACYSDHPLVQMLRDGRHFAYHHPSTMGELKTFEALSNK